MKDLWKSLAAACVVFIGIYACTAPLGRLDSLSSNPADSYYNSLVQGFRAGQLSLKREAPPGLARLADPYDPAANDVYQDFGYDLRDLSYYKGRLYPYFGATPAVILFWPFVALTGHYLSDRLAVTIFCAIGVLASLALLRALWRRYFAEVGVGVLMACALALGFATAVPTILPRSGVHEVVTSCGYMLTMLALGAMWCALHEPERRCRWLAAASLAYGLAVGARPSLLFGGVILLVPVIQAWRERRHIGAPLLSAVGPIMLIGLGLMLYNALRFDNPFEFGVHYQLAGRRQMTMQFFSLRWLWFNFRVYFLGPARWSGRFPFVHEPAVPPLPAGYYGAEALIGILTNIPLVWLALAAPLAWRNRPDQEASVLRWFVTAVALLFGIEALTIGTFIAASMRYAIDFLSALVLLAVIGILGWERVLAPTSESGPAGRPVWRRAVRWGWGLLLGFSVAFNVLLSVVNYAHASCGLASVLAVEGRAPEITLQAFETALRMEPDFADGHYGFANALVKAGKVEEAIGQYEQALRLKPDYAEAHYYLGVVLEAVGRPQDAIRHYEEAVRSKPDFTDAQVSFGVALARAGRVPEAMGHWERALRVKPDNAEAHFNLGLALAQLGRMPEAMGQYKEALRIKPDDAEAHYNLGLALEQAGRLREAIGHYEQALRLNPNYAEAQVRLARLRAAP